MNSSNKVTTRLGQLFTRKIDLIWFAATARVKVQNGRRVEGPQVATIHYTANQNKQELIQVIHRG